jgi:hypothetical protein
MASAQRSRARCVGAAACGMAGLRPSRDSALGCVATNALARGQPRASARRDTLVARSAARGGAAALTFPAHDGAARRPAHRDVARRRRAQGHGRSRSYEPSRASSLATWLAYGLAQSTSWCVATAMLAHARPRHAYSAQPSGDQRRSSRRGGSATTNPCTRIPWLDGRFHTRSSHGDGGAQGHEWPRSSLASRCGSSAARWPAHRQGKQGDASRRRRSITGRRPRGRKG